MVALYCFILLNLCWSIFKEIILDGLEGALVPSDGPADGIEKIKHPKKEQGEKHSAKSVGVFAEQTLTTALRQACGIV